MQIAGNMLKSWVFKFAKATEPPSVPEDFGETDDAGLGALEESLSTQFDSLYSEDGDVTAEVLTQLSQTASDLDRVRSERTARTEAAANSRRQADELAARIRPAAAVEPVAVPAPVPVSVAAPLAPVGVAAGLEPVVVAGLEPSTQAAINTAVQAALLDFQASQPAPVVTELVASAKIDPADLLPRQRRVNFSLAEMRRRAPAIEMEPSNSTTIVAAADIPGYGLGGQIVDMNGIADAVSRKGQILSENSGYVPVVQMRREWPVTLDENTTPEQVEQLLRGVTDVDAMVAAGGWCAPSLPLYDLFNIAAADGMIDLPTVGVTRGGIRFPVSPMLSDVLGNVWLWTETNDIAAATGSPTKACYRVACPTFTEVRLDAHGICVTAGNLTERAYPETVRNYIKLVMDAHYHVMNQRKIAAVVANSTALTMASQSDGVAAPLLNAIELQAVDYREKFGMADDSVLEVVLPRWADALIRADVARRGGSPADANLNITDAQIMSWFDTRDVRVQWVADWQTRGAGAAGTATPGATAGLTAWPSTLQFMLYAAGTHVIGDGGSIDLGVIRDSVLNATNDHTAAWTEEFFLTAKFGHESRVCTLPVTPDGAVGIGTAYAPPIA